MPEILRDPGDCSETPKPFIQEISGNTLTSQTLSTLRENSESVTHGVTSRCVDGISRSPVPGSKSTLPVKRTAVFIGQQLAHNCIRVDWLAYCRWGGPDYRTAGPLH
eukprot:1309912-Amorphochlora_amoeboformis.AAC.1